MRLQGRLVGPRPGTWVPIAVSEQHVCKQAGSEMSPGPFASQVKLYPAIFLLKDQLFPISEHPMPYEEITATPDAALQRNEVAVTGDLDAALPQTLLHLGSGRSVVLPTELLLAVGPVAASAVGSGRSALPDGRREMTIPLVAEQAHMGKETVTTGTVRLHRGTETFTETVGLPLTRTSWDVERRPVGELVAERPEPRQEGDTMIFPLVEERLVARREYFVIEEVWVRQVAVTTERSATLELKRDVLTVEREGATP